MTAPLGAGPRVLETILTGRNLLSPVLASAARDVSAFNTTVAGANEKAAVAATASARAQQAASTATVTSAAKASTSAAAGAGTQSAAADKIAASNVKASTSAQASAQQQMRAHSQAAQSATVSARAQESANRSLAASNGLLGTSLTPLTAGLGGAALAFGYAGFRGMEFGSAMSQVQAASQASAGDLDRLRQAALDAGADTQYSATEAAAGITELSKAGVSTADVLNGGLTGALNLAAAGQMEVADAAEIGATALSVFRLEGNQMSHVADLLAAGAGKAQGSVHDLGMALNQSALVANQTGLSIEDTAGALALFASNGLVGSDAGTSFKTMLQALTPNSEAAATAMADIGFSAYDAQGNFIGLEAVAGQLKAGLAGLTEEQRNSTLETIFGSDAVRAASVLYGAGADGVREWTKAVDDQGYASRQAAQLTDNLRGDLERAGGALDTFFTTAGEGAQGPLRLLVQGFTTLVGAGTSVLNFITNLPGPVMAGVAAMGALALINGPLAGAIGTSALALASWYGQAVAAAGGAGIASVAMSGLRAAAAGTMGILGGPLGLALIGATVAFAALTGGTDDNADATEGASGSQRELAQALRESKGALDANVRAAASKAAEDEGLLKIAEDLGLEASVVTDAILGQGDSYTVLMAAMRAARDAGLDFNGNQTELSLAADRGMTALEGLAGATEGNIVVSERLAAATAETGTYMGNLATAAGVSEDALTDWRDNAVSILASFTDPLNIYTDLVQEAATATADSTESSSDSWSDYADSTEINLGKYIDTLYEQLAAQEEWRHNIVEITQRGGQEIGDILFQMGAEGAGLVEQMVTANDEQFQLMKDGMIADARFAGEGAVRELQTQMVAMAIVGAAGGQATVQGLAAQLGLGADVVRGIAQQYGINLAEGVNPLLDALGQLRVTVPQMGLGYGQGFMGPVAGRPMMNADGNVYEDHRAEIAPGGAMRVWAEPETMGESYIPHAPAKRERSLDIWRRTGEILNAPEVQFFANGGFTSVGAVPRPSSTAPFGPPLSTAANAAMQREYGAVTEWLKENLLTDGTFGASKASPNGKGGLGPRAAAARAQIMDLFGITNIGGYANRNIAGTGVKSDHATGHAIDVMIANYKSAAGIAQGNAVASHLVNNAAELGVKYVIWKSRINEGHGWAPYGHPGGGRSDTLQHEDHVHGSFYDRGGLAVGAGYLPKATVAPERVLDPRQTAAFEDWMRSPAAMPGYGMGGGWGGGGSPAPVVVSAPDVQVQFFVDGQEFRGMARVVVDGRLEDVYRQKVRR